MAICSSSSSKGGAAAAASAAEAVRPAPLQLPQPQTQQGQQVQVQVQGQQQQQQVAKSKSPLHAGTPHLEAPEADDEIDVDLREVYFLIMHFLSGGPCQRATGQLWNELLQHKLLPRRYHGLYSRNGLPSTDEDDDGCSFPLSYSQVSQRFENIDKNHLVRLLQQLLLHDRSASLMSATTARRPLTAADVPTLLGSGSFSLLESDQRQSFTVNSRVVEQLRWPHWQADQVHALALRQIGGGFARHQRCPSTRTAKHVIANPSLLVDRINIIKVLRGHRNAVYCAIFDRSGQHLITGSDDRLVKFWSAESGLCLRSCRGHEGDITHLAVSIANTLVASASNDSSIRVWRFPDGVPVAVLRGHTAGVTAIQFRPRQGCENHLLSSSDDGTCRIWDARDSSINSRVFMPKPEQDPPSTPMPGASEQPTNVAGVSQQPTSSQTGIQISCCAFNADGSFFVTGSSDKLARVWDARKWEDEYTGRPNYELDILSGHEDIVNYVQFSGCAEPTRPFSIDVVKEDSVPRLKNSWFAQDSIVTCSKDGTAIIWSPRPRKQVKLGRWVKAYHLKVPPPPMPVPNTRAGGPRQRPAATPRGVNMIVWSLDNRFVLATIMDCRICVWNAVDGSLLHCLTGHTKQTYVLDVHPHNPRVAMSAGYDGLVIIWDIWEGRPVRTYETGDFNLVDGNFSPDGTSLVVSDEVGQVYLFGTGLGHSQKDAKYDQFFLGDFRPLTRDTHGNVLDQETQLPPHQRNLQDLLCDANMLPYSEPYQSAYQQRRLGALGIDWHPPSVQLAVGTLDDPAHVAQEFAQAVQLQPLPEQANVHARGNRWVEQPTDLDAMDWDEEANGFSDDSGSDYCASEESVTDDDGVAEESESAYTGTSDSESQEPDYDSQAEVRIHTRRSDRNKRKKDSNALERPAKKSRIEDPGIPSDTERPRRRAPVLKLQKRASEDEQSSRPMRVAARNALSMFSNLNEEESNLNEEEDDEGRAAGKCAEVEEPKSVAETSEAGECRRPRSQRKLVLKLRNRPVRDQLPASVECSEDAKQEENSSPEFRATVFNDSEDGGRRNNRRKWKKAKLDTSSSDDEADKNGETRAPKATHEKAEASCASPRMEPNPACVFTEADQHEADLSREQDQMTFSNESLQNGETADDDPDYNEDAAGGKQPQDSDSDPAEQEDMEQAGRRSRRKVQRNNGTRSCSSRRPSRRKSRRIAKSTATGPRRMSTRNRASRALRDDGSSSFENEVSDWSDRDRSSGSLKLTLRSSARLKQPVKQPVGRRVDYRYQIRNSKGRAVHDRSLSKIAWLLSTDVDQQRYIPQYNDQVVYFRQGHQNYLEQQGSKETGPWSIFKRKLRAVEYCQVVGMHYVIGPSGETLCELTLEFTEGNPETRGSNFTLILPELTQNSDFVVERSRYEDSVTRTWSNRDKCLVWWRSASADENGGGSWWEGRVKHVKPSSPEFPDSPWDSILVRYKAEPDSDTLHSPWELFESESYTWSCPRIDDDSNRILLDRLNEVSNSSQVKDEYGLWTLQQAITKPDFYNSIPLPLSMEIIKARVESKYYRNLDAVLHDLNTLISNFRLYFGDSHQSVHKVERLSERFSDIL